MKKYLLFVHLGQLDIDQKEMQGTLHLDFLRVVVLQQHRIVTQLADRLHIEIKL